MKLISVVTPALNEEKAIGKVIDEIKSTKKQLKKMGYDLEIIVVDGKSKDKTGKIAKKKGARVLSSERGYGLQYRNGFEAAKGEIIVTGDSDMTYPFFDIPRLVNILEKDKLEFITCNRFANLKKGSMSISHHLANWGFTKMMNILFLKNIKDSQSGMWVFKKEILKKINLKTKGMPFSLEIKIEAITKTKSKEVSITYRKRIGEIKLQPIRDGLKDIIYLIYKRVTF